MLAHVAGPVPSVPAGTLPGLLLLLHGSGDDEFGLLPLGVALAPAGFQVVSLRAPLPRSWGGFCWFEGMSAEPEKQALESTIARSCDSVFEFVQQAPEKFGTDPSRVFLLGFSQGATTVWTALMSRWPRERLITGAIAISGRLMPDLMQEGRPLNGRLAGAAQLRGVPVFASHGRLDGITPFQIGRENEASFGEHLANQATPEPKLCYQVIEGFTVPVRSFPDGVVGREKARLSSPTVVECSGQRDGAWVELSTGGWISAVLLEDGVTPILKQVEPAQQQEDQVAGGIFTFVSYGDDHEIGHQCQRDVKEWLAKWAE